MSDQRALRTGFMVALLVAAACAPAASLDPGSGQPSAVATASPSAPIEVEPSPSRSPEETSSPTPLEATPSPSVTPAPGSLDEVGRIAASPDWTPLLRVSSRSADADGVTAADGEAPGDLHVLLVSVACSGTGMIALQDGHDDWSAKCPATASKPRRALVGLVDDQTVAIRARPSGEIAFRILVEAAPTPLAWPVVRIGAATPRDEMILGCGVYFGLSWGWEAVDDCGTSIPDSPLPVVSAPDGTARITVRAWTISDTTTVHCGVLVEEPGGFKRFKDRQACSISTARAGPSTIVVSGIPSSVTPWLIELYLSAENEYGDRFGGPFYAYVSR